jgi:hypothetical protein
VPWGVYTTSTLGTYTPGTTHSWSVAYYSLGMVPGNKYGIVAQDEWLYDRAAEIGERSPWSLRANEHFHKEFNRIVASDPAFMVRRVGWGLFVFASSGAFVPDFRLLEGRAPQTVLRLRYASRDLARSLGMPRFMMSASMHSLLEQAPVRPTKWDMALVHIAQPALSARTRCFALASGLVAAQTKDLTPSGSCLSASGVHARADTLCRCRVPADLAHEHRAAGLHGPARTVGQMRREACPKPAGQRLPKRRPGRMSCALPFPCTSSC